MLEAESEFLNLAFSMDGIDVCRFSSDGVQKLCVIAYPSHSADINCRAFLYPAPSIAHESEAGWYNFYCYLAFESEELAKAEITQGFPLYPPAAYIFQHVPEDIAGIRVIAKNAISFAAVDEFIPELADFTSPPPDVVAVGGSPFQDFREAYFSAMLNHGYLPGYKKPVNHVKAVCALSTNEDSHALSEQPNQFFVAISEVKKKVGILAVCDFQ